MENRHYQQGHYVEITVTAQEATSFQIFIGSEQKAYHDPYILSANSSVQVKIDSCELVEAIGSEEVQNRGIHLVSKKPVNVYALNWSPNSADVAIIYPTKSLGKEYFAMCYYPDIDMVNQLKGNGRNSEFLIVATEDGTVVEITPSRVTDQGRPKDSTFSVLLNSGEVYQVQSENIPDSLQDGQGDLTGSYISSNHPVAFFSGALSTRIPKSYCCWDHLYEQIPPLHSWGTEYYLVPLKTRKDDRYRIMAYRDQTVVNISGSSPIFLNRGEFREIVVPQHDPKRVTANNPVLIAQYSQSRDADLEYTGGNGDPFMILLNPVSQSKNEVTFVAYESPDPDELDEYEEFEYTGITNYYVNIITPTKETGNIRLNGDPVSDAFSEFPEGPYSFAQIEIHAGTNHIENLNKQEGFLAYVYGYGGVESYGYGVGFNLNLKLDLGESEAFVKDTMLLCPGKSLTLDAGFYFDTYLWSTGDTTQTITVSSPGWIHVETTTNDGCELKDSVYIFQSDVVVDLGPDTTGCYPFQLELTATDGYAKYLWQNNQGDILSTSPTLLADSTGIYNIMVTDKYNCTARDVLKMTVLPVPDIKFNGSKLVCGEMNTSLSVSITGTADSIWNFEGSTSWTTPNNSLILSNKTHDSVHLQATEWGVYEVSFHIRTIDGCEKTETFQIRFHPQPDAAFSIENDERCEGYSQELRFTGEATGSADFFWDLNGCQVLDTLGYQHYLVSVGAFLDKQPVISLSVDDNGCISEPFAVPVGANPNFTMDANIRRGCDELTVDFSSTMLTEDFVEFNWEFDDGTSAATSNHTKHFDQPGFYGVKLTVTNPATQCINSYKIDSMIRVFPTPVADMDVDPQYCYPDTVELIYTHNIDSSVCHWEFNGMHILSGANDSVLVYMDNPVAQVKLTVDEYGCFSDPVEKQLKRNPRFDFQTPVLEGCHPFQAEISTSTHDINLTYEWITDTLPYPTGDKRFLSLPGPGIYNVGIIANSHETGCTDTLIKTDWIRVNPKPFANFSVNYPVAFIDNSRISFFNRSEDADLFEWDFGDGSIETLKSPIHEYTDAGDYLVHLYSRSLQGCEDTALMQIKIMPSPVYTPNAFRPDSHIPENQTFLPISKGIDSSRYQFTVYNRDGQVVFDTRSADHAWDGLLPNGKPAPMGNYIWVARYFDVQGTKREQKGQVLLIR
ncbi:MAG: PKD domain-containing protein [Mariniphaga sp.]|nr:PKD domain-containing protein [Mariniphaga sp.]